MKISEMIEVLQAAERGEVVEIYVDGKWIAIDDPEFNFGDFDYRIAPKKEMTLVEELRNSKNDQRTYMEWQHEIMCRAADRIEELEKEVEELKRINRDRAMCMHERVEAALQHIQQQKWVA